MNLLRRTAAAAALATVFAAPAAIAQAQNAPQPDQPKYACKEFLKAGTNEAACGASVRHWASYYAQEQQDYIEKPQGPKTFGDANNPELMDSSKLMTSPFAPSFVGHIKAACETVRGQDDAAPLQDTVLAADKCLSTAHQYGVNGGTNTAGIEDVGATLGALGKQLQSRAAAADPVPAEPLIACAEYLANGKGGQACAQSIAYWTMAAVKDVAAHAGADGDALLQGCQMLEKIDGRTRIGFVASMAIKCLTEAARIAEETGYADIEKLESLQDIVGQVGLASIGRPQPRDLPKPKGP